MSLVCDFCRQPDPTVEYPCKDVQLPGYLDSFGPWCACEVCAMLITMDDREALARRAEVMTGVPEDTNRTVQALFFLARTGKARPIKLTPMHGRFFQR